jgi:hypothetical protein
LSDQLLAELRASHGRSSPAAWSVAINCEEPLCVPAEWYDEETIRGDVLRQFRELDSHAEIGLVLDDFLPEGVATAGLGGLEQVAAGDRGGLLLAASKLGVDLLELDEDDEE